MSFNLDDYVDVPERIAIFREKWPYGSLQSEVLAYPTETYPFVVVKALAYRNPDDKLPGIGHSAQGYPGITPYTKGSEMENAETSAWGRAIIAALAADAKRGIASRNEVQAKQGTADGDEGPIVKAEPAGTGAKDSGESSRPGTCTHPNVVVEGPTGRALPPGKVYCTDCRTVVLAENTDASV